jgi:tryptophan halogenase
MINTVTIVGGGFAGWYTAAVLQYNCPDLKITVIESPTISRLRVGESLGFDCIFAWKNLLGLEADDTMMRQTGAIYKYGVLNRGFFNDNEVVAGGKFFNTKIKSLTNFYNKFEYRDFYEPWNKRDDDVGILNAWMFINRNSKKTYNDLITECSDSSLFVGEPVVPYNQDNINILRQDDGYAYHIDAEEWVSFFKSLVKSRGKVTNLLDTVIKVELNQEKEIVGLILEKSQQTVTSDLYIDCSGFNRVIGKHIINDSWQDRPNNNNAAYVCPSRYTDPHKEMTCGTITHGEEYGWRFQVNLYHRRGNGYIFNTDWFDADKVKKRLEQVVEGTQLADCKLIKWKPGFYSKTWNKNCILMGVAAGFIDPWDAPTFSEHTKSLEDFIRGYQAHRDKKLNVEQFKNMFNLARSKEIEERHLRLQCSHGLSNRSGPYWERKRNTNQNAIKDIEDVILQRKNNITSRLNYYWEHVYVKIAVQTKQDMSHWDFPTISDADIEIAKAHFDYNRSRNKYISKQQWPNAYDWLKKNKFQGATSQEILEEFQNRQ